MRFTADPLVFQGDARQYIWLFSRSRDMLPAGHDYMADYLRTSLPVGYRIFYSFGARIIDPRRISKILPYVLLLLLITSLGLAGQRLGGRAAAWAAIALCLSSGLYLDRMNGGLLRAFAFPMVAATAVALVAGRPFWLAGLTVFGAAFYPATAVLSGLSLTGLLLLPRSIRGRAEGWSRKRSLLVLSVTFLLTIFITLPSVLSLWKYGPPLLLHGDVEAYPEIGLNQRFAGDDHPLFGTHAWYLAMKYSLLAITGTSHTRVSYLLSQANHYPLSMLTGMLCLDALIVIGFTALALKRPEAMRLLILLAVVIVTQVSAPKWPSMLYLSQRYLLYSLPILLTLILPAAAAALPELSTRLRNLSWAQPVSVLLICGLTLLFIGGRGPDTEGLYVRIDRDEKVYPFLSSLPPDALIAGWPGHESVIDNVPYVTLRSAFITFENHLPFQRVYTDTMRQRMQALIEAYFATDVQPLLRLRDSFGVTHLITDERHYTIQPPQYFKPFDVWTREAYDRARQGLELSRQASARVFVDSPLEVFDLRQLKVSQPAP